MDEQEAKKYYQQKLTSNDVDPTQSYMKTVPLKY
jgi:hypothetical protein